MINLESTSVITVVCKFISELGRPRENPTSNKRPFECDKVSPSPSPVASLFFRCTNRLHAEKCDRLNHPWAADREQSGQRSCGKHAKHHSSGILTEIFHRDLLLLVNFGSAEQGEEVEGLLTLVSTNSTPDDRGTMQR